MVNIEVQMAAIRSAAKAYDASLKPAALLGMTLIKMSIKQIGRLPYTKSFIQYILRIVRPVLMSSSNALKMSTRTC